MSNSVDITVGKLMRKEVEKEKKRKIEHSTKLQDVN
jgi:hypothetical protein